MGEEENQTLGDRLRGAAERANLSSSVIGKRLGVSGSAVRQWWLGSTEPSVGMLQRYAEICGESAYYLITGESDRQRIKRALEIARRQWATAVSDGVDAAEALEALVGDAAHLQPDERERLSAESDEIRQFLVSVDGEQWVELTPEQHQVVAGLVELLAKYQQQEDGQPETDRGSVLPG